MKLHPDQKGLGDDITSQYPSGLRLVMGCSDSALTLSSGTIDSEAAIPESCHTVWQSDFSNNLSEVSQPMFGNVTDSYFSEKCTEFEPVAEKKLNI